MRRSRPVRLAAFTLDRAVAVGLAVAESLWPGTVKAAMAFADRIAAGGRSDDHRPPAVRAPDLVRQDITDCRWCANA